MKTKSPKVQTGNSLVCSHWGNADGFIEVMAEEARWRNPYHFGYKLALQLINRDATENN